MAGRRSITNILSARLVRTVRARSAHWQRQTLFLIVGIIVGGAAIGLALARNPRGGKQLKEPLRFKYALTIVLSVCRVMIVPHRPPTAFS